MVADCAREAAMTHTRRHGVCPTQIGR